MLNATCSENKALGLIWVQFVKCLDISAPFFLVRATFRPFHLPTPSPSSQKKDPAAVRVLLMATISPSGFLRLKHERWRWLEHIAEGQHLFIPAAEDWYVNIPARGVHLISLLLEHLSPSNCLALSFKTEIWSKSDLRLDGSFISDVCVLRCGAPPVQGCAVHPQTVLHIHINFLWFASLSCDNAPIFSCPAMVKVAYLKFSSPVCLLLAAVRLNFRSHYAWEARVLMVLTVQLADNACVLSRKTFNAGCSVKYLL